MSAPVFEPADAGAAAALLARAGQEHMIVVPRGSGTKLSWNGAASAAGVYLSTRRLSAPVEHYAGDLVATIPSGATLAHANAVLARAGQWLPLDPSHAAQATIGGIVATNDSGPRRHKYGSPRDLIIGIEIALTDGRIAKAGGRVVKNVAGYDVSRLICGSFGSLAVITSATFKLAPIPAASRTVLARLPDVSRAAQLARALVRAPITPSAIEIEAPAARLIVRFETTERAADQMAAAARTILEDGGASTEVLAAEPEHELWRQHEALIWHGRGIVLKVSVLPTDVEGVFGALVGAGPDVEWAGIGRAALGVLLVRVNGDLAEQHSVARAVRRYAVERGGTLVVLEAPAELRPQLEASNAEDRARGVMRAVKERFDPRGILGAHASGSWF